MMLAKSALTGLLLGFLSATTAVAQEIIQSSTAIQRYTIDGSIVEVKRYGISSPIVFTNGYPSLRLEVYSSNFNLHLSATNPANNNYKMRNPVIITQGFDPNWSDPTKRFNFANFREMMYTTDTRENSIARFIKNGYDVVTIIFDSTNISIERNSLVAGSAFRWIQQHTKTDHNINIIGPSMGGLICRHALQRIGGTSSNSHPNFVKPHEIFPAIFIAFDSPNWGAVIPVTAQATVGYLSSRSDAAREADRGLSSEAARQMLLVKRHGRSSTTADQRIDDYLTPTETMQGNREAVTFFNNLNNPTNIAKLANLYTRGNADQRLMRTVAIANGTRGVLQNVVRDVEYFFRDKPLELYVRVSTHKPLFSKKVAMLEAGNLNEWGYWFKEPVMLEQMPGGTRNTYSQVFGGIKDSHGGTFYNNSQNWNHAFVPTASAIGVDRHSRPSGFNLESTWLNPSSTSFFHKTYVPNQNQKHMEINSQNIGWILGELAQYSPAKI